ncbi:hypothetical protein Ddye_018378 [Dipteronia dyeriana]|uniref:B box-type domain-containing protein n=1 Tax=Dipteronia dyeriana TaxID=168575 RepID=A0AAD9UAZ6_9ROSI|nr:hypothetical protein Ddye_018378 [Dipteronia dyeriana]
MKNCELCKLQARTYCESDQASLCWSCDAKVHAANFLVARHSRTLLCHVCQSPTPWKASGEKLGHTVSVCNRCVNGQVEDQESQGANDDADDEDEGYDDDEDDDVEEDEEEEEEEEEEDGENQVVPWSSMTATPPPPAASSSSSSEEFSDSVNVNSLKRFREDALDLQSQQDDHDLNCFSSKRKYGSTTLTAQAATVDSLSPLQDQRTEAADRLESSVVIVEPHKRSRNQRGKGDLSGGESSGFSSRPI